MGVYHFMGVGLSAGAVTAPLSYIAARYKRDSPSDQTFFAESGEVGQLPETKRGDIQALVLFTTQEVYRRTITSYPYILNQPGMTRGKQYSGEAIPSLIRRLVKADLATLTETSRIPEQLNKRSSVEIYWCLYEPNHPTQTFERVAQCLLAAKSSGRLGKEIWINLTGGSNVLNSALQLAVSLSGQSARLYYTWTEETGCARHPVSQDNLGAEQDRFWVDLPLFYFNFDPVHQKILDLLATFGKDTLSVKDIYSKMAGEGVVSSEMWDAESNQQRLVEFRNQYLLPLKTQGFLLFDSNEKVTTLDNVIKIGPNWSRLQRYYQAFPSRDQSATLPQLAKTKSWLFAEEWPV